MGHPYFKLENLFINKHVFVANLPIENMNNQVDQHLINTMAPIYYRFAASQNQVFSLLPIINQERDKIMVF